MLAALDIATTTGWAAGNLGVPVPLFGEHDLTAAHGRSEDAIFAEFERWLDHLLRLFRPHYLIAEDVFHPASMFVAQRLYGLRALCTIVCHRHDIRLRRVNVQRVHRFFTGGGEARGQKKALTIARCRQYGWMVESDNQADALALFAYLEAQLAPTFQRSAGPIFARAG